MKKRILTALLTAVLLLSCVACADEKSAEGDSSAPDAAESQANGSQDGDNNSGSQDGDNNSGSQDGGSNDQSSDGHTVSVTITAADAQVDEDEEYDLKKMFSITADGTAVEVTDDMIDAGGYAGPASVAGEYTVSITYISSDGEEHTASAKLTVCSVWIGPF